MKNCPICQREMIKETNKIKYEDFICRNEADDHVYIHRIKDNQIAQLKIRLTEINGSKMYVKIYYDQGRSELWTRSDQERIKIDFAFDPDFSDMEKFKKKIQTYFLFS